MRPLKLNNIGGYWPGEDLTDEQKEDLTASKRVLQLASLELGVASKSAGASRDQIDALQVSLAIERTVLAKWNAMIEDGRLKVEKARKELRTKQEKYHVAQNSKDWQFADQPDDEDASEPGRRDEWRASSPVEHYGGGGQPDR